MSPALVFSVTASSPVTVAWSGGSETFLAGGRPSEE